MNNAPILEFDPTREAVLEPSKLLKPVPLPDTAVACFFQEVITARCADAKVLYELHAAHGTHPIYELMVEGERVAVFHPGVGAPLAAGFLEEVIALGSKRFVVCGGAGALVPNLILGHVVVPTSAVRDEGTSYHYLPPDREVVLNETTVAAVTDTLREASVPFVKGKTWTTDALYRETKLRVERRRSEGCVTVEMEAAALLAVAEFRSVPLGYLLYAGDSLAAEEWDHRGWQQHSGRDALFDLALQSVLRI